MSRRRHLKASFLRKVSLTTSSIVGGMLCFSAAAFCKQHIVIWHTFDALSAKVLSSEIDAFEASLPKDKPFDVKLETGMDITLALMDADLVSEMPDAIIGPSDFLGHARGVGLVPLETIGMHLGKNLLTVPKDLVTMDGVAWGVPLLWGNHFMQFHRVSSPGLEQVEQAKNGGEFGFQVGEPYAFLMLVLARLNPQDHYFYYADLTIPRLTQALNDYAALLRERVVAKKCDYHCLTRDFYQGNPLYAINGDWALAENESKLKESLVIAPLPKFRGKEWRSPCTAFSISFTKRVANDENKQKFLSQLIAALTSPAAQKAFFSGARRVPADEATFRELQKKASGNNRVLFSELERAMCIRPDRRISEMWPVLRKGLRLFTSGVLSAEKTAHYILNGTTSVNEQ